MNGNIDLNGDIIHVVLNPGIRPSLWISIRIDIPQKIGAAPIKDFTFSDVVGTLILQVNNQELPIGPLVPAHNLNFYAGEMNLQFITWVDGRVIEALEKERRNGDGHLRFRIRYNMIASILWMHNASGALIGPETCRISLRNIEFRMIRDDWLQQIQSVGFRKLRIFETPD